MAFDEAFATIPPNLVDKWKHLVEVERCYEVSVFEAAGEDGVLTPGDARRLLRQHGETWDTYLSEQSDGSRHPAHLLGFLGYSY